MTSGLKIYDKDDKKSPEIGRQCLLQSSSGREGDRERDDDDYYAQKDIK